MKNKIIMHINYCEQGQTISEICEKAAAWGFDGVEFRNRRSAINEDMSSYLESIYKESKKYGHFALSGVPIDKAGLPQGGTPFINGDEVFSETVTAARA